MRDRTSRRRWGARALARGGARVFLYGHLGGAFAAVALLAAAALVIGGPAFGQQRFNKLAIVVAEGMADQGFWSVDPRPLPPEQAPADGGAARTAKERFLSRLEQVDLDALECDALFPKSAKQVVVLVHGIGGAGEEWEPALAPLSAGRAPLLMYRWRPSGSREAIARALAGGLNRLVECLDGNTQRLLVVAHSAGGVLAATAAPMLKPKDAATADRVALVTVASPLGGMGLRSGPAPRGWQAFVEELGGGLNDFGPAPAGVRVLHVRTHPAADKFAKHSSPVGRDAGFVVPGLPGARAVDLDATVDHSAAVQVAAEALRKDSWKLWQKP